MMDVKGKTVFLTGGAKGIGRAMVESLLSSGARILFCDIDAGLGKAAEKKLQKQYGADNVVFVQCDVSDAEQLNNAFQKAVCMFEAVDVCVNNAGIMSEKEWEKMLAVNTTAQIRGSKLALQHMRRDRGGRGGVIINMVSVAGLQCLSWHPVYAASKHAMVGFTVSWARNPRAKEIGVRWCCFCPGPVFTDMTRMSNDKLYEPMEASQLQDYQTHYDTFCCSVGLVVGGFMKLLKDEDNNGCIMEIWKGKGVKYRKRQLVDEDGVSNSLLADEPLIPNQ